MCVWCVCVCVCAVCEEMSDTVGLPSLSGEDHGCRRPPLRVTLTATTRRQSTAPPTPPSLRRGCFNACCSCLACKLQRAQHVQHTHAKFTPVVEGRCWPLPLPSCLHTGSSHARVTVTSHVTRLLTAVCYIRHATSVISLRGRSLSPSVCVCVESPCGAALAPHHILRTITSTPVDPSPALSWWPTLQPLHTVATTITVYLCLSSSLHTHTHTHTHARMMPCGPLVKCDAMCLSHMARRTLS
jgi:hypothetical protein